MAIAVRGVGAVAGGSSATTNITASATPNLPASSAAGDRVYVFTVSTGTVTAPANWTEDLASTALGGGAAADTTGTRLLSLFHRDYDGVWTMPSFTTAAVAAVGPGIEVASIAFSLAAGEQFNAPTLGSGSDSTATGTSYSATTGSFTDPTGGIAWLLLGWPGTPGTLSALSLSASGATFGGNTSRHGVNGQSTGRDVFLATWTYPVTVGTTNTHTAAVTGTTSGNSTMGAVVLSQTVTVVPVPTRVTVSNPAAVRAANW